MNAYSGYLKNVECKDSAHKKMIDDFLLMELRFKELEELDIDDELTDDEFVEFEALDFELNALNKAILQY